MAFRGFYVAGLQFDGDVKSLLHGISGSFLGIPVLYLIYEIAKDYSNKNLNKEIFDYAKMQIDQDVLSIINQLMKLTLPYNEVSISSHNVTKFLSSSEDNIKNKLEKTEFLGFQVFKSWEITENNISKVLENVFILKHLSNDQIIAIINLLKVVQSFDQIPKNIKDIYIESQKNSTAYKIEKGENINPKNIQFPDRCLLLRKLGSNKYVVCDFGDFPKYQIEKLLHIYKLNPKYSQEFAEWVFEFIKIINNWLNSSGNEFIINKKLFKPVKSNNVL